MDHVIRPVPTEEWAKAKEIRLAALKDPVAHLAFLETYEQAVERPDSFWQDRAAQAAEGLGHAAVHRGGSRRAVGRDDHRAGGAAGG